MYCYTLCFQKRLLVFPNGESPDRGQYVWGESIGQILDNATSRLNLRKPAKYIFNMEGELVST